MAKLTARIALLRANVLEVSHDRVGTKCAVGQTYMRVQIETRGPAHVREITGALEADGYKTEVLSK